MLRVEQLRAGFLPGALSSSGQWLQQAGFGEAPPAALCAQALALQLLRWAASRAADAVFCRSWGATAPLVPGQCPAWLGCRLWSGIPVELLHKLLSYDVFKESGCSVVAGTCSQIINAYHWWMKLLWMLLLPGVMGNLGVFLVFCKDCLEGEVSRGFCAQPACSGGLLLGQWIFALLLEPSIFVQ